MDLGWVEGAFAEAADLRGVTEIMRITGKTFMQYLNFVRVREAEKLILTTDKNISEIAQEVGFTSVSGFNKAFKKERDLSPIAYKKQHGALSRR